MTEVVVSASAGTKVLYIWDVRNGSILTSLAGTEPVNNGTCLLGHDLLVSAQSSRPYIHFWRWNQEAPVLKSAVPERIVAVAGSPDGNLVVAGTLTGQAFIWMCGTGQLLTSWRAHYKQITAICFTGEHAFIVTAGEDGIINVWSLASVYDSAQLEPFITWSEHTLPITNLYRGLGGARARIISSSLDRTCRLWDLPSKKLLATITFPTALYCVTCDASEKMLFSGAEDGNIYCANLTSPEVAAYYSRSSQLFYSTDVFRGHTAKVTQVVTSMDGALLISGAEDGQCFVWDIASRQQLHSFTHHRSSVTSLLITRKMNAELIRNENSKCSTLSHLQKTALSSKAMDGTLTVGGAKFVPSLHHRLEDVIDIVPSDDSYAANKALQSELISLQSKLKRWENASTKLYHAVAKEYLK